MSACNFPPIYIDQGPLEYESCMNHGDSISRSMSHPTHPEDQLPPIGDLTLTRIIDLRPFTKGVSCRFIVIAHMDEPVSTREGGYVFTYVVADESACIVVCLWNEVGQAVNIGDIILITAGYAFFLKKNY